MRMLKFRFYIWRRSEHVLEFRALCKQCLDVIHAQTAGHLFSSVGAHQCDGYVIPMDITAARALEFPEVPK